MEVRCGDTHKLYVKCVDCLLITTCVILRQSEANTVVQGLCSQVQSTGLRQQTPYTEHEFSCQYYK
jgi:hypothetical protein